MPRTHMIDVTEMFEPVEIKLWDGSRFLLRQATQSVEKKVEALQNEINALADKTEPLQREARALRRQITGLLDTDPGSAEIEVLEEQLRAKEKEILEKSSTQEDGLPFLIEMLDVLLDPQSPKLNEAGEQEMIPAEVNKDGSPKKGAEMVPAWITASEVIKKELDADNIGITHIDALSKKLNETAMEARPA